MITIDTFEQWEHIIASEPKGLLFVKTTGCSVCEGLLPQVEPLEKNYSLPFYKVNIAEVPELAGQLSLFTAPVVIIWNDHKEIQRFARFVPMQELTFRLDDLEEWSRENE